MRAPREHGGSHAPAREEARYAVKRPAAGVWQQECGVALLRKQKIARVRLFFLPIRFAIYAMP